MAAFLFRFSFSTCFLALSSDVNLHFLLLPSASAICTIITTIIITTILSSSKNILLDNDQNILAHAFCVYCHNKHDTFFLMNSFTIVSQNHNFFFLSPLPSAAVLLLPSSACSFSTSRRRRRRFLAQNVKNQDMSVHHGKGCGL